MTTRRTFLRGGVAVAATSAATLGGLAACGGSLLGAASSGRDVGVPDAARINAGAGALRQSVCRWCYRDIPLPELARAAKGMGLQSVELLEPEEFAVVAAEGLGCAMANAPGEARLRITRGFNRVEQHALLIPQYVRHIELAARAGVPNLICFSGTRAGMSNEEGLAACATGLRALTPIAERAGVTLCMELLNSKVDHRDYQCDHTAWGAELVTRVASPRFRLLYDIYHMQIMEGDVIRTIRQYHDVIVHYHTGGVPGRHEIDDGQELFYPAIMRAIRDTGFTGYVAQEFIPVRAPLESLADAVRRCTI